MRIILRHWVKFQRMLWFHSKALLHGYQRVFFEVLVRLMFNIFHLVKKNLFFILSYDENKMNLDEQNCTLKFASWTYDSARVDLSEKSSTGGDLSNFMNNSGWQVYWMIDELFVCLVFYVVEWEIVRLHVKKNVVKYSCCKLKRKRRWS